MPLTVVECTNIRERRKRSNLVKKKLPRRKGRNRDDQNMHTRPAHQ